MTADEGRHPRRHGLARISRKITGRVYVVHLDKPLGGPKHQARHYKGSVKAPKTAQERLQEHKDGKPGSAAILRAANERGIGYHIVCDWPGNPHIENQIKLYGATRICPECTPDARVPLIVQAAIRAEKRQAQRAARKEAQAAAAAGEAAPRPQLDPYEDGQRMARQWLARQDEAGRTADQIEAVHEYVTGPWREMTHHTEDQAERYRGYTDLVRAALAEFREYEAAAAVVPQHEAEAETGPAGPAGDELEERMQENEAGSWLARDGDGQVLEVDAAGHPGREASPDDGRPVAEAADSEPGGSGQYQPSPYDMGASNDPDLTFGEVARLIDAAAHERMASDRDRTPERVAEMEMEAEAEAG